MAKILGTLSILALSVTACEQGFIEELHEFDENIEVVEANLDSSKIKILPSTFAGSSVEADVSYFFHRPEYDVRVRDGKLSISLDCHGVCEGTIIVRVPSDVDVQAECGSGGIVVDGMEGELDLEAGSGSIKGRNLRSPITLADAGSGSVSLSYLDAPLEVDLEAGSGSVKLTVPRDNYDISVKVGSGSTTVENIVSDPGAPKRIRARAGSGSVTVRGY